MIKPIIKISVLLFSLLYITTNCTNTTTPLDNVENQLGNDSLDIPEEQLLEYGLPVDSFLVVRDKIKKNENLSDILLRYEVDYGIIDRIARNFKDTFDVRTIRTGNKYAAFCSIDSLKLRHLQYFIYERTSVEYVVFDLRDSIFIKKEKKTIEKTKKQVHGTISSSLWNAMVEAKANPLLSVELSNVYAWSIDFFGLQKGDEFKVIYEEEFVGDHSLGIGQILGAIFLHNNHKYYAIPFAQDSIISYFDEDGNSLRKTFLKAPLKFYRISSRFSNSRMHPVLKIRRPHHGVDYAAPTGTPVYSVGDGKVIKKGYQKRGGGRYLKIKHNSVYTTTYMHFSKFAKNTAVGTFIKQGQVIGYVGQSGLATGPHLDFRYFKNGTPVDPLKVKSPPAEPILERNKELFNNTKTEIIKQLKNI